MVTELNDPFPADTWIITAMDAAGSAIEHYHRNTPFWRKMLDGHWPNYVPPAIAQYKKWLSLLRSNPQDAELNQFFQQFNNSPNDTDTIAIQNEFASYICDRNTPLLNLFYFFCGKGILTRSALLLMLHLRKYLTDPDLYSIIQSIKDTITALEKSGGSVEPFVELLCRSSTPQRVSEAALQTLIAFNEAVPTLYPNIASESEHKNTAAGRLNSFFTTLIAHYRKNRINEQSSADCLIALGKFPAVIFRKIFNLEWLINNEGKTEPYSCLTELNVLLQEDIVNTAYWKATTQCPGLSRVIIYMKKNNLLSLEFRAFLEKNPTRLHTILADYKFLTRYDLIKHIDISKYGKDPERLFDIFSAFVTMQKNSSHNESKVNAKLIRILKEHPLSALQVILAYSILPGSAEASLNSSELRCIKFLCKEQPRAMITANLAKGLLNIKPVKISPAMLDYYVDKIASNSALEAHIIAIETLFFPLNSSYDKLRKKCTEYIIKNPKNADKFITAMSNLIHHRNPAHSATILVARVSLLSRNLDFLTKNIQHAPTLAKAIVIMQQANAWQYTKITIDKAIAILNSDGDLTSCLKAEDLYKAMSHLGANNDQERNKLFKESKINYHFDGIPLSSEVNLLLLNSLKRTIAWSVVTEYSRLQKTDKEIENAGLLFPRTFSVDRVKQYFLKCPQQADIIAETLVKLLSTDLSRSWGPYCEKITSDPAYYHDIVTKLSDAGILRYTFEVLNHVKFDALVTVDMLVQLSKLQYFSKNKEERCQKALKNRSTLNKIYLNLCKRGQNDSIEAWSNELAKLREQSGFEQKSEVIITHRII